MHILGRILAAVMLICFTVIIIALTAKLVFWLFPVIPAAAGAF